MNTKIFFITAVLALSLFNCQKRVYPSVDIDVSSYFKEVCLLAPEVIETSGLALVDGQLWTQNDSGDEPKIYQINAVDGTLERSVLIEGAKNTDWEELAMDENFMYVADFGNNAGARKDLAIYKVPISSILEATETIAYADKLEFEYASQQAFEFKNGKHNFDCEALIVDGDDLFLFSKNRADFQCQLYKLPKDAKEKMTLKAKATFDVQGTITAADYSKENGVLVLLGYNFKGLLGFKPFLWVFHDFKGQNFFSGKSTRIDFPVKTQTEGVVFESSNVVLISCEAEDGKQGQLYRLDLKPWLK